MAENKHSTDGIAEDLIRSMVQMAAAELHVKTLIEKRTSEIENGLIDIDDPEVLGKQFSLIGELQDEIIELAQIRREDMLYLYELYGSNGDKEKWCQVKHLAMASMTAFEAWQASANDVELLNKALRKNALFIKTLCAFLGTEITECAACFSDIIKGGLIDEASNL
ncbi:hypothetical protein NRIC_04030 [Enterococcus florum]|uniref:Uncharacterized protein n=1 Tax=Enterococcus florum TaxID=2480627 RepID=A0A4P5PAJ0_9ENTE|nr:hypothetical protein [Enterococcus florum]GCF92512.1 hypothetical protein NRIC_04030 [Enterococcus florum]